VTKYVPYYAFVTYGKTGRPVGEGEPAEEGREGGGNQERGWGRP